MNLIGPNKTVAAIYKARKDAGDKRSRPPKALGASRVGVPCLRAVWYVFRHCAEAEFDGRMYRLFERGDLEEPRLVEDLKAIGCEVHEVNPKTGKQWRIEALDGHFVGYLDAAARGIPEAPKAWHVCEFKTCNNKTYNALVKHGVLKTKPEHYAQMMVYMHYTGMKRALYLSVRKETDEIYAERVRYNKEEAEVYESLAKHIISLNEPPSRCAERPDYYLCKFCDSSEICWGEALFPVPRLSCRQCCHASPAAKGEWHCRKKNISLTFNCQLKPCEDHLILPPLLTGYTPVDYGKNEQGHEWIKFQSEGDTFQEFVHCRSGNAYYSSEELRQCGRAVPGNKTVQAAKEKFGAKVADSEHDILARFHKKSEVKWRGDMEVLQIEKAWNSLYGEKIPPASQCLRRVNNDSIVASEYVGGRAIVARKGDGKAEIWELTDAASS